MLKKLINVLVPSLVIGLFAWVLVATVTFRFRHPWATETETLLNMHRVMTFQRVEYKELRPR